MLVGMTSVIAGDGAQVGLVDDVGIIVVSFGGVGGKQARDIRLAVGAFERHFHAVNEQLHGVAFERFVARRLGFDPRGFGVRAAVELSEGT